MEAHFALLEQIEARHATLDRVTLFRKIAIADEIGNLSVLLTRQVMEHLRELTAEVRATKAATPRGKGSRPIA